MPKIPGFVIKEGEELIATQGPEVAAAARGILPGKLSEVFDSWFGRSARAGGTAAAEATNGAIAGSARGMEELAAARLGIMGDKPPMQLTDAMRAEVTNLREVAPGMFRSGLPSDEGLRLMKEGGLKNLIVLRHSEGDVAAEAQVAKSLGLNFTHIKMNGETELTREQVGGFLGAVENGGNCLWHCVHGRERTGAMTAIFRMAIQGKSNEEAVAEMIKGGFRAEKPQFAPLLNSVRAYPRFLTTDEAAGNIFERGLNLPIAKIGKIE